MEIISCHSTLFYYVVNARGKATGKCPGSNQASFPILKEERMCYVLFKPSRGVLRYSGADQFSIKRPTQSRICRPINAFKEFENLDSSALGKSYNSYIVDRKEGKQDLTGGGKSVPKVIIPGLPDEDNKGDFGAPISSWFWEWKPKLNVHYEKSGCENVNSPPVLFLPGFGVGSFHYEKQLKDLGRDHRIWAIDFLGQGKSLPCEDLTSTSKEQLDRGVWGFGEEAKPWAKELVYSIDLWKEQVHYFIEEVIKEPVYIVGNSLGGYVAIYFTARYPHLVKGVTLLNATPFWGFFPNPVKSPRLSGVFPWTGSFPLPISVRMLTELVWEKISGPEFIAKVLKQVYADHTTIFDKVFTRILETAKHPAAAAAFASIMFAPRGEVSFEEALSGQSLTFEYISTIFSFIESPDTIFYFYFLKNSLLEEPHLKKTPKNRFKISAFRSFQQFSLSLSSQKYRTRKRIIEEEEKKMSFILGVVIGITFGLGIIVAFVKSENARSKYRTELASGIAAFARMTVEDSRKIFTPEQYPSWVVFSNQQKLKWLNSHLEKIWPYVDEAASELVKSSVEPILEQYRPVILASLKFSKFTLGTVAPQFTGISIIEDGSEGITMELEMQWDGNPSIILDIKTYVGVALPVQVKNIGFTGIFRLIFRPLVDEFPCFGAVCYSLRQKKKLDFTLKVIGGDMTAIPGLSDAIEGTIRDAIEDSITWPVRKVIPILPGDYSDLELKPIGVLEVKLIQAKELTNKDLIGKSDPFTVLYVRPIRDRMKKSKIINNDLNPIWNEHFEFVVEDPLTQHLVVKIYDDEGLQSAELLGCAHIRLNELEPGKVKDIWLKLVKDLEIQRDQKNRGEVHLELLYCPIGMKNGLTNPFAQNETMTSLERVLKNGAEGKETSPNGGEISKRREVIVRGVLSVTVISADDLPPADIGGKADPYAVLIMKKAQIKNKTRVVNESLNPVWNQTFDFVVEDGLHDMLIVEVWDHDTFGKDFMGKCILTLTRVLMEGEYKDTFELSESKSGKLNLHLKWNPQPLYRDSQ